MLAPAPKLAACLAVLYQATIAARILGWEGEAHGLSRENAKKLGDLMDAVHNIPGSITSWERCNEALLRGMLHDYDERHGAALLDVYDSVAAKPPSSP